MKKKSSMWILQGAALMGLVLGAKEIYIWVEQKTAGQPVVLTAHMSCEPVSLPPPVEDFIGRSIDHEGRELETSDWVGACTGTIANVGSSKLTEVVLIVPDAKYVSTKRRNGVDTFIASEKEVRVGELGVGEHVEFKAWRSRSRLRRKSRVSLVHSMGKGDVEVTGMFTVGYGGRSWIAPIAVLCVIGGSLVIIWLTSIFSVTLQRKPKTVWVAQTPDETDQTDEVGPNAG